MLRSMVGSDFDGSLVRNSIGGSIRFLFALESRFFFILADCISGLGGGGGAAGYPPKYQTIDQATRLAGFSGKTRGIS